MRGAGTGISVDLILKMREGEKKNETHREAVGHPTREGEQKPTLKGGPPWPRFSSSLEPTKQSVSQAR
jgi:hypothetical protein